MSDETSPDKQRGMELLSEFAHEIRTPLTAMLGYTSFLKGDGEVELTPLQVKDFAERLHTSTKRLLQITERVLDEAVSGTARVKKENVDFTAFSNEIVKNFEADAEARGIRLVNEIAQNFPVLVTDPVLLYEMLSNLISNALKFTPKGGMVKIKGEVDVRSKGLILVIQDTGKGIPASIVMHMLQGASMTTSSA
ncbi:HAMP domain-containing sensor histidine kinase [Magnetovibrio sp.]|uniref:sensor histidine kinase n=1 Tax=Magnetovibrio sp. TaxID=2024836 RepID=UPI002F94530A